jgi:hypothetical protein
VALTTRSHLKKEYSCTSARRQRLPGLFYGKFHFYLYLYIYIYILNTTAAGSCETSLSIRLQNITPTVVADSVVVLCIRNVLGSYLRRTRDYPAAVLDTFQGIFRTFSYGTARNLPLENFASSLIVVLMYTGALKRLY